MRTGELDAYYRRLGSWNRVAAVVGYGGGHSTLTVHRALADPAADGRPTFTRLHDLLIEQLPPVAAPRVLDAGCGAGGTMLDLAERLGATCTGLTLSHDQCARANDAARRRGRDDRVHAMVGSYDHPPPGPFDVVVAIESLAHSPDPARSVDALVARLAPAGTLAVVDDMPHPAAREDPDLALFKAGWRLPVLWSADAYRAAFQAHGLTLVCDVDLTGDCRPRTPMLAGTLLLLARLVARIAPSEALRDVMRSHQGGLALERLIRRRHVQYRMLVASRQLLQVS
jgi:SAM-dependent methyltransferase